MRMNSKISSLKNKLKPLLKNKQVIDVIVFGSFVKGKVSPNDIDIAIISKEKVDFSLNGFHISQIKPEDFFINTPTLVTTLLREGFSLKKNKSLAETLRFTNSVLFVYNLTGLNNSEKVKIVKALKGNKKSGGMVREPGGEWLANQVFLAPINSEHLFDKFFLAHKVKYKKNYVLIH